MKVIHLWIKSSRERERELKGLPIGNLTSQLFANVYLNPFDHFMKERLRAKYYLRYTDDSVLLHHDPVALVSALPIIREFLRDELSLSLHPKKIDLRKFNQGADFLGYVSLPYYRVLRANTKKRMLKSLTICDGKEEARMMSYLGLLQHCEGRRIYVKLFSQKRQAM